MMHNIVVIYVCEGCFYDNAAWPAEGDHDVDLGLEMRESNPKLNRGRKVWPQG
jgi:hypothetical protein